jgi:hypothetical protein
MQGQSIPTTCETSTKIFSTNNFLKDCVKYDYW